MDECLGWWQSTRAAGRSKHPGFLEIKLLRLHVGSGVKVEGPFLSGVRDQAGIFINLETKDTLCEITAEQEKHNKMAAGELTSSPEKYWSIISKASL